MQYIFNNVLLSIALLPHFELLFFLFFLSQSEEELRQEDIRAFIVSRIISNPLKKKVF